MSNNDQYFFTDLQKQYINWGLMVGIIIFMVTMTIATLSTIDKKSFNAEKQKEQCGAYDGTMVYTIEHEYRCFKSEIILKNYYNEYVKNDNR